ncbi:endonuclease G [Streptomyces sp. 2112.3]|uniref:DNA/RNA non-specific endonuclease n=1 Tax=Streptomyces sp. 2112.3 TaxID=1881023 RepID=UPI00089717AD|nr:DNA/RNA non-specific endonuclease [Streptomyces sp. 2112.3]SEF13032.1 endonuclease G [Streptomyces sp. 2112.3]
MIPSEPPRAAGAVARTVSGPSTAGRAGYDEHFLGVPVPLPVPAGPAVETVVLPYTHFTVVLRPDRRMAAATAVCIDGERLPPQVPPERDWQLDPRLDKDRQTGEEVYRNNSLDKGHLVGRLDPVWGEAAEAHQAHADTFHYPNAAPQADVCNRSRQVWEGLAGYLLDHAARPGRRLAVLTGPVLHDSDPPYRGVQVPLRFWKVAAFLRDGSLAATAYVLDQSPDLIWDAERALAGATPGAPPVLGAFRTFQVPVTDVAELTSLNLGPLPAADLMPVARTPEDRWKRLASHDDIVLQRR